MDAKFGPGESGAQAPIAVAQKALGDQQAPVHLGLLGAQHQRRRI
jgi:hypothetical protein